MRLIDADHLFDRMRQAKNNQPELGDVYEDEIKIMAEWIRTEPSADVRENKHGIWIETGFGCECPFCGNEVCMTDEDGEQYKPNYCECCGADMRERKTDGEVH